MDCSNILTLKQAEERFPVKRVTLMAAIKRGALEGIRIGHFWFVSAGALGEWMAFGKHTPGPEKKEKPPKVKRPRGRPRKEQPSA